MDYHYLVNTTKEFEAFYQSLNWSYKIATPGDDLGPFLKFSLAGDPHTNSVATLFSSTHLDFCGKTQRWFGGAGGGSKEDRKQAPEGSVGRAEEKRC